MRSELERTANTSDAEKLEYADRAKAELATAVRQINKMLEVSRRDGDADKIQCLTSRITSVRALQYVTDGAAASLRNAIESGESDRADHEFRKIAVALGKTRQLAAEAQQCDTGAAIEPGETLVELLSELLSDGELLEIMELLELDVFDFGQDAPDLSAFK